MATIGGGGWPGGAWRAVVKACEAMVVAEVKVEVNRCGVRGKKTGMRERQSGEEREIWAAPWPDVELGRSPAREEVLLGGLRGRRRRVIKTRVKTKNHFSMNPPALFLDHRDLNFKDTELRLGLPGTGDPDTTQSTTTSSSLPTNRSEVKNNKRASPETEFDSGSTTSNSAAAPFPKAQVVGWPPIRSYRKKNNNNDTNSKNNYSRDHRVQGSGGVLVKVSVDGAPYLRKIDLKAYRSYRELLMALEAMFRVSIGRCIEREGSGKGSDYDMTYEDRDGDWMLAGDVPWEMFVSVCKRLRIMRFSEVKGLGYHL
ncbi:hypothetical protein Drorol1_Dr00017964 [Drosera rotundifolia]